MRFSFAIEIADAWFNVIKKLSAEKISQLQAFLDGKTMIGEYVGHQDHQHLVK